MAWLTNDTWPRRPCMRAARKIRSCARVFRNWASRPYTWWNMHGGDSSWVTLLEWNRSKPRGAHLMRSFLIAGRESVGNTRPENICGCARVMESKSKEGMKGGERLSIHGGPHRIYGPRNGREPELQMYSTQLFTCHKRLISSDEQFRSFTGGKHWHWSRMADLEFSLECCGWKS